MAASPAGTPTKSSAIVSREVVQGLPEHCRLAQKLPGEEIDHELLRSKGPPAAVLVDQGVELDLLVIGSRGYGPLRRTLLGGFLRR